MFTGIKRVNSENGEQRSNRRRATNNFSFAEVLNWYSRHSRSALTAKESELCLETRINDEIT